MTFGRHPLLEQEYQIEQQNNVMINRNNIFGKQNAQPRDYITLLKYRKQNNRLDCRIVRNNYEVEIITTI